MHRVSYYLCTVAMVCIWCAYRGGGGEGDSEWCAPRDPGAVWQGRGGQELSGHSAGSLTSTGWEEGSHTSVAFFYSVVLCYSTFMRIVIQVPL